MSNRFVNATGALLCIAVASLTVACAKDDVAPVDVEKQAFDDLRTEIHRAIDDPVREAETIRLVGVLQEDLAALRTNIAARKSQVRELNANYDTPRAKFEAYLAGVEAEVRDHKRRVSETHRALLANVTAEERSAIAKSHTKAMNAAITNIQSI
jgi:capsule polysaccharide export protein KpsE/RkpR